MVEGPVVVGALAEVVEVVALLGILVQLDRSASLVVALVAVMTAEDMAELVGRQVDQVELVGPPVVLELVLVAAELQAVALAVLHMALLVAKILLREVAAGAAQEGAVVAEEQGDMASVETLAIVAALVAMELQHVGLKPIGVLSFLVPVFSKDRTALLAAVVAVMVVMVAAAKIQNTSVC